MEILKVNNNYLINEEGEIFSKRGKKLKKRIDKYGYVRAILSLNGLQKDYKVHRLVASQWLGLNIEDIDILVCHRNDIRSDNKPGNLFLGTAKINVHDCISKGRFHAGINSKNKCGKITRKNASDIRMRILKGEKQSDIAKEYGLSDNAVSDIKLFKTWRE